MTAKAKHKKAQQRPKANPLWGGRFAAGLNAAMSEINASIDFDRRLYAQDIAASKAHASMLAAKGIISRKDGRAIARGLETIRAEIEAGRFRFSKALEDIHMNIESRLADLIGEPAGRLHTARSRNDQVATDFKLWVRDAIDALEVYNLAGGIEAYRGPTATGPQEMNLDLVRGDEGPAAVTLLAAGMERALQLFYETLKDRTPDWELLELFGRLARVEESHRQRLLEVYRGLEPDGRELDDKAASTSTLEGGFPFEEFLAANAAFLNAAPRVLDLAMMLETQALDLYLRLARRSANPLAQTILLAIAEEEKGHLASLGQLLAAKAAGAGN